MSEAAASWKIGEARITAIVEQSLSMDGLISRARPETLAEIPWLHPDFVDETGKMLGLVQCFVVELGGKVALVDTCVGDHKDLPTDPAWNKQVFGLIGKLRNVGFDAQRVDMVLCTHLHLDHVGINTYLSNGVWHPTFPKARYLFSRTEYEYWQAEAAREPVDPATLSKPFEQFRAGFQATQRLVHEQSVEPVFAAGLAELVDPPCEPMPGLRLVSTPGHTPGHVSVEVSSAGEKALITGDAFHHPCQIARSDWATVADYDRDESTATRKAMLEDLENTGALMLGSHFARPTGGRVVRDGETWKLET